MAFQPDVDHHFRHRDRIHGLESLLQQLQRAQIDHDLVERRVSGRVVAMIQHEILAQYLQVLVSRAPVKYCTQLRSER